MRHDGMAEGESYLNNCPKSPREPAFSGSC